ncbi:MAG: hypothetical protein J5504_01085 [Butyrivibrio sp.]|nr:hypothetical protein [Butyrivibrio sp.]
MSKGNGFGKFILFCTAVGAAAAGVYYYLSKRDAEIADSFDDDDFEEFEDFDEDLEETNESRFGSRKYVDIKTAEEKTAQTTSATESTGTTESTDSATPDEFFGNKEDIL